MHTSPERFFPASAFLQNWPRFGVAAPAGVTDANGNASAAIRAMARAVFPMPHPNAPFDQPTKSDRERALMASAHVSAGKPYFDFFDLKRPKSVGRFPRDA